jgi:hypothetical protein
MGGQVTRKGGFPGGWLLPVDIAGNSQGISGALRFRRSRGWCYRFPTRKKDCQRPGRCRKCYRPKRCDPYQRMGVHLQRKEWKQQSVCRQAHPRGSLDPFVDPEIGIAIPASSKQISSSGSLNSCNCARVRAPAAKKPSRDKHRHGDFGSPCRNRIARTRAL